MHTEIKSQISRAKELFDELKNSPCLCDITKPKIFYKIERS